MSIQTLRTGQFIHGQEVAPASGAWLENKDPATGGCTGLSARGNAADIDAAVVSAKARLKAWLALLPYQRGQRLQKLGRKFRNRSPPAQHWSC